ncbi:MAG: GNAT family N-acetyltransferase [Oscillospiraceae bacterium]|jgi:GNAT superfamily N-acetyltransferase|nr:GNAT family N-acetyltransferase [Oscillospiraceae bacterium]
MTIREAGPGDLASLLALYTHLHDNPLPDIGDDLKALWSRICADPNHHIILGFEGGQAVSSCVLVVIDNLTNGQRPYALVENVVTHAAYRMKGYASRVLEAAGNMAKSRGCYKIMLMTGSKEEATLNFYRRAGYNSADKTAFIRWLR